MRRPQQIFANLSSIAHPDVISAFDTVCLLAETKARSTVSLTVVKQSSPRNDTKHDRDDAGTAASAVDGVMPIPELTVGEAFGALFRNPAHYFLAQWNWKSALTSALIRGAMFFATNITAGFKEASWALLLQFVYRAATSGFWGSFTQAMRNAKPRWLAALIVGVGLSVVAHALELLIHWAGGTAELKRSILVSVCFTVISNLFNLYIMQRNALLVGENAQSFGKDMAQMPGLIAGFLAWPFVAAFRAVRGSISRMGTDS